MSAVGLGCVSAWENSLRVNVFRLTPIIELCWRRSVRPTGLKTGKAQGEHITSAIGDREDLRDVIMSLGGWGQRWIESSVTLKNFDPSL